MTFMIMTRVSSYWVTALVAGMHDLGFMSGVSRGGTTIILVRLTLGL